MSGFVYLIRNKDLYKIGRTQNLEQRMRQLKPDEVVSTFKTSNYEELEKQLHRRYKDVRLPQSEYFRLTDSQIIDCKIKLGNKKAREEETKEIAQDPFMPFWLFAAIFLGTPIAIYYLFERFIGIVKDIF